MVWVPKLCGAGAAGCKPHHVASRINSGNEFFVRELSTERRNYAKSSFPTYPLARNIRVMYVLTRQFRTRDVISACKAGRGVLDDMISPKKATANHV
ncbi:hypothetical protein V6N13_023279 [Hibiscus sabdariffa]